MAALRWKSVARAGGDVCAKPAGRNTRELSVKVADVSAGVVAKRSAGSDANALLHS